MFTSKVSLLPEHLQQIALLLTSSKFEETSQFYLKISQIVAKANLEKNPSFPFSPAKMVIIPEALSSAGFALLTKWSGTEDRIHDPDGRPIWLCSNNSEPFQDSLNLTGGFAVILRSSCIETTKSFYEQLHECVEERHGNGPRHYSINWDQGPFTEIYPKRKSCLGNMEILFQTCNILEIAREMDIHGLQAVSIQEKVITLQDPEGRKVNIYRT